MKRSKDTEEVTKQGAYGTLYLHRLTYCDVSDRDICFEQTLWAYDFEHAIDKFYGGLDAEGWKVTKISRVRKLKHREISHEVEG